MSKWSDKIYDVSQLPSLNKRAGDKVRFSSGNYVGDEKSGSGRKPKVVQNAFVREFREIGCYGLSLLGAHTENILVGVCRVNWYRKEGEQRPLSLRKLVYVLGKFDEVTYAKISWLLDVEKRQAQRYLKAAELALEFINKDKIAVNELKSVFTRECELDTILGDD